MIGMLYEVLWPWIAAAALTGGWVYIGCPFPTNPDGLFGTAATMASVFASFLGVAKAIILSIKTTTVYETLTRLGYTDTLFSYLRMSIFCSVLFAALSILGFFIDKGTVVKGVQLFTVFAGVWVFAGGLALFGYLRITNIMFKLLKRT